jgi:transcriptional regulator
VSPRWFASTPNVPSWNYEVVHASGPPRLLEDPARVRALLERSAARFEAGAKEPWTLASVPENYVAGMQRAIVAFEIPIDRLEGKRKLSQNKSEADRAGIAAGLRAEGRADGIAIATAMELPS